MNKLTDLKKINLQMYFLKYNHGSYGHRIIHRRILNVRALIACGKQICVKSV